MCLLARCAISTQFLLFWVVDTGCMACMDGLYGWIAGAVGCVSASNLAILAFRTAVVRFALHPFFSPAFAFDYFGLILS
jgi:hypothetical protein